MKSFRLPALLVAGLLFWAPPVRAAARQYVVVVAEGLSPQLLDLGERYAQRADEDTTLTSAFTKLAEAGKTDTNLDKTASLAGLAGWLETARESGFKTGLVTTGDLTTEAALFYKTAGETTDKTQADASAKADFLAGGGRADLKETGARLRRAGGTYVDTTEALVQELRGRVLVAGADDDLSYALDRNPETEPGLGELVRIALDRLGANDTPFVLVVHDTLVQKALNARDTPALFEEFRELNSILEDALSRREENPNLGVAALGFGAVSVPRFVENADADKSFSVIGTLGRSYSAVGKQLHRAKIEAIDEFIDPEGGEYRDWKLDDADKKRIASGKLSAETAVRAWYEPFLGLDFTPETALPVALTAGIDTDKGLVAALQAAVARPAKTN